MPPQKPSALGALKARPYTPKPAPAPQDIWDVDALLADSKEFAAGLPSDPLATAQANADLEASMTRQRNTPPDPNAWKSKVGVIGALADSAATPIRVMSGFGGPAAGFIGEGIAQGLEGIAHLDGKPLRPGQGENVFRDAVSGFGRAGTAALFGNVGGAVPALVRRSGLKSLAARVGLGATAGAAEGAASNVAQGALYRGFADGRDAAFDPEAMELDAKLGFGIGGATGGALTALNARAGRGLNNAGTTRFEGPMPENASVNANGQTINAPDPYWKQEATEGFEATPWSADDLQAYEGSGRTPVARKRFDRMNATVPDPQAGAFPEGPAGRFPQPPEDFVPPSPPPTGPQPPGPGRLPGGGGVAFDPFVPPEGTGAPDLSARDDFWAAMDETFANEPPAPDAPAAPEAPMVRQPFEGRVPPDVAKVMRNDAFGVPTVVRFDGQTVHITYNNGGKIQTQQLPAAALDAIPELDALIPRAPGEAPAPELPDGPSFRDDPAQMDAIEALMAERNAQAQAPPTRPPDDIAPAAPVVPAPRPDAPQGGSGGPDIDIEALLRQADAQDAAVTPPAAAEPDVTVLDPDNPEPGSVINGSGDSQASNETMRGYRADLRAGKLTAYVDRAGRVIPSATGPDAVNVTPPNTMKIELNADGTFRKVEGIDIPRARWQQASVDEALGELGRRRAGLTADAPPPAAANELDRIVLEGMDAPPPTELFGADLPGRQATPEPPAKPEVESPRVNGAEPEILLGSDDTPGTINQAGKFTPIDREGWQSHEPAKNKNLVVRKADGTYQVVKNNGGKTPKTWSKELASIRESEAAARKAKEEARQAALAAKRFEKEQAAATKAEAGAGAGEPPAPVVAAPDEADALVTPEGPTTPPRVARDRFGDHDAVDVVFERAPADTVRQALKDYGFRYLPWKQKWSFKIPKGSSLTPEEVEQATQAILRGESVESVQKGINADSLNRKATEAATAEGRWAPEPGKTEILDRDLAPEAADRDARRQVLIGLGWKQTKNAANRRVWNAPGAGMAGDMGRGAPEVAPTPTNPPQAEPSTRSATDAQSATTTPTSTTQSGTADGSIRTVETPQGTIRIGPEPDEVKLPASMVKVDAEAYQFKTTGNIDAKGRSDKLKGVEEWDEMSGKTSRPILHKRLDGSYYVVDGHQRVGLAQELSERGTPVDIRAVVLDEADGVTVEDARRAGAIRNIMGGTTDPMDIARIFRDGGELTPAEQAKVGRIQDESGERFRQGRDLAKLEPAAFTYLLQTGDTIEPRYARLVSQYQGEELQVALLRALERNHPQNVSAAKSILAKASDMQATVKQPGIFEDMPTVADVDFEELVKFEQKVLGVFKKNKRVFGKGLDNAAFLENAGETKIDREAMAAISGEADRSQFLFDKYANANGSETKRTLKEVFDEHQAGRLSLGAAADRVAKALEADFTGRPRGGGADALPSSEGGPGTRQDGPDLWGDEPEAPSTGRGSISDAGAVARGADGALDDDADDILDFLKRQGKKLFEDESGALNVGDGVAGLEDAYKRNPGAVWTAMRAAGGAFLGGATHDEDDPDDASILDNLILGAAAGIASKRAPGVARALARKAPTLAKDIRDVIETGRLLARGEYKVTPTVRKPPDLTKDISGFAQKIWTPDKVVPDVWAHIEPIMRDIYKSEIDDKLTPSQRLVARKMRVEEAVGYMLQAYKGAKDAGHFRRAGYIKALRDELLNKPTFIEQQVNELTNGKITPKRVRQANAAATNLIYHNLLGWAVDSGLANMTQALMNIPQIGVKSTVKGIITAYSKKGRQEFDFLDLNRRPMGQDEERLFYPWFEKYLDWSQEPMRFSDSANRRATYAGALDYAKKRNMSPEKAKAFANELVGQTQGIAGDLGNNPFHRHLGPLRVFTKFPMVWASMLQDIATHPDPAVKMRALGMMTGIYAFSAISGVEAMNFFWPRMGGLPGPAVAVDVMSHAFGAPDHEFEEHFQFGGTEDRLVPRFGNKAAAVVNRFEEYGDEERPIIGRKGQVLREISAEEDLLSLFGIETTGRADTRKQESEMYETAAEGRRQEGIRSRRARREAGYALGMRDEGRASRALEALSDRQRKAFLKDRAMTTRDRARRLTPLRRRQEFDEAFEAEQP